MNTTHDKSRGTITSAAIFRSHHRETGETAYTTTTGSGRDGMQIHLETITQTNSSIRDNQDLEKVKYSEHGRD